MTSPKSPEALDSEALTVLKQWRGADRRAVAEKGNDDAKRAEYQCRNKLRNAADALPPLPEVPHG